MVDINIDFNALADKIGEGLTVIGSKLGVASENLMVYGVKYEVARGVADLGFYALFLLAAIVISLAFVVFGFLSAKALSEGSDMENFYLPAAIITGIVSAIIWLIFALSAFGPSMSRLDGVSGAITRVYAPEAALIIEAAEIITRNNPLK